MSFLNNRPRGFVILIALTILTAFTCPLMVALLPVSLGVFILLYPLVCWLGALLAWAVYPSRSEISDVLLIVVWMSFGLLWLPLIL